MVKRVLAVALLAGCAGTGKTIWAPKDAPPPPPPAVERSAPGAEVRQAGEVLISAQETLNRVGGIVNPTRPGVAAPAVTEPAPPRGVALDFPQREAPPVEAWQQPDWTEWPETVDRSASMYWWNKGGDAFHTNRECPYLKADAVPVVKGLAMTRRPCRTCGSPGTKLYQGGGSR